VLEWEKKSMRRSNAKCWREKEKSLFQTSQPHVMQRRQVDSICNLASKARIRASRLDTIDTITSSQGQHQTQCSLLYVINFEIMRDSVSSAPASRFAAEQTPLYHWTQNKYGRHIICIAVIPTTTDFSPLLTAVMRVVQSRRRRLGRPKVRQGDARS
jgi:hypothetical protein